MDLPGPEALFKELRSPGTSSEEHTRKIQLAETAWKSDAQRLPLPRKGQFILEWLLERLLKTRNDVPVTTPPLVDVKYWQLLLEILRSGKVARELKQTVIRIPVLPTLAFLLGRVPEEAGGKKLEDLLSTVNDCYEILLPLAVSSSNTDSLLACSSSFLASSSRIGDSAEWTRTAGLLCASLDAVSSDRNTQKKLLASILDKGFSHVLTLYGMPPTPARLQGRASSLALISKLFFSAGNLERFFSGPLVSVDTAEKCLQELFAAFKKANKDGINTFAILAFLPDCLQAFYAALQANAADLFANRGPTTSSRSAAETHIQQQTRYAVFGFLSSSLSLVQAGTWDAASRCTEALLKFVEDKPVYAAGPGEANQDWLRVLRKFGSLHADTRISITGLHILARIDFAAVQDILPSVLVELASSEEEEEVEEGGHFVETAIEYHGKTRQLPHFLSLVAEAIGSGPKSLDDAALDAFFQGPLLRIETREKISLECAASLSSSQAVALVDAYLKAFKAQVDIVLEPSSDAGAGEMPKAKKRKTGKTEPQSEVQGLAAYRTFALAQILSCVVGAVATPDGEEELSGLSGIFSEIRGRLGSALRESGQLSCAVNMAAASLLVLQANAQSWFSDGSETFQQPQITTAKSLSLPLRLQALRARLSAKDDIIDILPDIFDSIEKAKGSWSGYAHRLDDGTFGIALWHLIVQQHLDLINQHASDEQSERFIALVLHYGSASGKRTQTGTGIAPETIATRVLHSAEFYEMSRLQAAFIRFSKSKTSEGTAALSPLIPALLVIPASYVDRATQRGLVSTLQGASQSAPQVASLLLQLTSDDPGNPLIKDGDFLVALAKRKDAGPEMRALFDQLWRLMLRNCNASPDKLSTAQDVLQRLEKGKQTIAGDLGYYLSALSRLVEEVKLSSLNEEFKAYLSASVQRLNASAQASNVELEDSLMACCTAQLLQDWLATDSEHIDYSAILASKLPLLLGSASSSGVLPWLELASRNAGKNGYGFSTFILAGVLLRSKLTTVQDVAQFETMVAGASQQAEEADFGEALAVLETAIQKANTAPELANALHMTSVLVCRPPDSGARLASQAFSSTLRSIARLDSASPAEAVSAGIAFIKRVCEHKITILEVQDVAVIWSTFVGLGKASTNRASVAAASRVSSSIYLSTIDIASAISSHRRDLLVPTFPQLVACLSGFMHILQAGGHATNPAPMWASSGTPWAKAHHARALTRLLVSLNTKSATLQHHKKRSEASRDDSNPTSLAGPLSKHAPFILVAFLRAATDNAAPLVSDIRKELTVGILEILGTMGKYEREALMRGFLTQSMEAERTLLKQLWKDQERVRYKGD